MNFGMDGIHTRRKEEGKVGAKHALQMSPDVKVPPPSELQPGMSGSSHSSSTPSSKQKFSSSVARRNQPSLSGSINAGDLSIFSSKLRALMVVREQIEHLAQQHKQEETRLAQFMKQLLRGGAGSIEPAASREQLVAAIADRDKAIATLDQFRTEINEVMNRMHRSLLASHSQHEQDIKKIELLTNENVRLRSIVFDVYGSREDLEDSTALDNAERTIVKLNELLQEADAVLVNLRANNEELLRQNHDLRQRDRNHHEQTFAADDAAAAAAAAVAPSPSPGFGSDSMEEAASSAEIGRTTAQSTAMIEALRAELRKEKRHRLEAEEVSHQIMVEHTKNVRLLEQRLHHRGTPKETPRKSSIWVTSPTSGERSQLDLLQQQQQQQNSTKEADLLFEAREVGLDEIGEPGEALAPATKTSTHSRAASDWSFSGVMPCQAAEEAQDSRESPNSNKSPSALDQFLPDTQTRELLVIERELLRVAESLERES